MTRKQLRNLEEDMTDAGIQKSIRAMKEDLAFFEKEKAFRIKEGLAGRRPVWKDEP